MALSCTIFETYLILNNTVTLKSGAEVIQSYRYQYNSMACLWFPIVSLSLKCTIYEIFTFVKYRDLETQVSSYSRSLEITQFNRLHVTSYLHSIETLMLACTVSEI